MDVDQPGGAGPSALASLGPSSQEHVIMAPGPIHRGREYFLGKFSLKAPEFKARGSRYRVVREKPPTIKIEPPGPGGRGGRGSGPGGRGGHTHDQRRDVKKDETCQPWLLESYNAPSSDAARDVKPGWQAVQRGVVEAGLSSGAHAYFVLVKAPGKDGHITAHLAKHWYTFKPMSMFKSDKPAADKDKEGGTAKERKEKEGAAQMDSLSRLLMPKSEREKLQQREALAGQGGRKRVMVDDLDGRPMRRGGPVGEGIDPDDVPEDIYAGAEDLLRPERPDTAEDWEHEEVREDDDGHEGDDGEVYDDDPGMRRKLGLESDDTDEEDETTKAIKKTLDEEEEEEDDDARKAADEDMPSAPPPDAADKAMDDNASDDEEDIEQVAQEIVSSRWTAGSSGAGAAAARRDRTPPPAPASLATAAAAAAAPAHGGSNTTQGGGKRKADPDSAAAAKRARLTPEPPRVQQQQQVKQEPSAAAPTAPEPPPAAAGGGTATLQEVVELLRGVGGQMSIKEIKAHFSSRTKTKEAADELKALVIKVATHGKQKAPDGSALAVLRPKYAAG